MAKTITICLAVLAVISGKKMLFHSLSLYLTMMSVNELNISFSFLLLCLSVSEFPFK